MKQRTLLPPNAPMHYAPVVCAAADVDAFTADEKGRIIRWVRDDGLKPELWKHASKQGIRRLATCGTKLA